MTEWSERLPDKEGYYWIWTGGHMEVGSLEISPGGPVKTLTTCTGIKAPIFNGRLFNGWQIGAKIDNPAVPKGE